MYHVEFFRNEFLILVIFVSKRGSPLHCTKNFNITWAKAKIYKRQRQLLYYVNLIRACKKVNKPVGPVKCEKMVCLQCDFKILLTVFNQSYNGQTNHYLGRN